MVTIKEAVLRCRLLRYYRPSVQAAFIAPAAMVASFLIVCAMRSSAPSPSKTWLATARGTLIPSCSGSASDFQCRRGSGSLQGRPRVVVSLSTFSSRILRVNFTLESLLRQTLLPDRIYLAIPDRVKRLNLSSKGLNPAGDTWGEKSDESSPPNQGEEDASSTSSSLEHPQARIPSAVQDMVEKSDGIIKVLQSEDYGPSTKLLPALLLEQDPATVIVTVDDDVWYHEDTVATLVAAIEALQKETPGSQPQGPLARASAPWEGVSGEGTTGNLETRGGGVKGHAPCWYCEEWRWGSAHKRRTEGVCQGWLGAFAGAAYYRGWFDDSVFEYARAPKGCRLHDDVWVSGNLRRKGIRPYVMRPGFDSVLWHAPWNALSIHSVPGTERAYRDPCVRHFDWFKEARPWGRRHSM